MNRADIASGASPNAERSRLHCDSANLRRKQQQQALRYQLDIQPSHVVRQSHTQLKEEAR